MLIDMCFIDNGGFAARVLRKALSTSGETASTFLCSGEHSRDENSLGRPSNIGMRASRNLDDERVAVRGFRGHRR